MLRKNDPFYEMDLEEKELRKAAKKNHKKEARQRVEKRGSNHSSVLRLIFVGVVIILTLLFFGFSIDLLTSIGQTQINVGEEFTELAKVVLVLIQTLSLLAYLVLRVMAVFIVLALFGRVWNSAFKLPWIMIILVAPVIGLLLYLFLGRSGTIGKRMRRRYALIRKRINPNYNQE